MKEKVDKGDNVIEGNRLIAEFDGYKRTNREFGAAGMKHWNIKEGWYDDENLKYHSSWDWLHSAWERFRDLKLSLIDEGFHDSYSRHCQAISTAIYAYSGDVACWRLVRAIEWYNKNKEQ